MKKGTKLSAAALAGLMALSMTACGAASDTARTQGYNASSYDNGQMYNSSNRTDSSNSMQSNGGTLHRNGPNADNNTRRSSGNIGQDIGNGVRDMGDNVKQFFDNAVENGRVTDNHGGGTVRGNATTR